MPTRSHDHPPSWRERLGGRWAISWQATLLGGGLMLVVVTLAGTSIGARSVLPDESAAWFLSALVGVGLICAYTLLAHLTVLRQRAVRPVAVPLVVGYHLGLGVVFALGVTATAHVLGLVPSPVSFSATIGFAVGALVWCTTVTLLLDDRERFTIEHAALVDEVVLLETQWLEELAVVTSLSQVLARSGDAPGRPIPPPGQPDDDDVLVPLDGWWELSATLRTEDQDGSSSLGSRLRDVAEARYPAPRLRTVASRLVTRQPFSIAVITLIVAVAYAPDGVARWGTWGVLASLGLAGSVAGVLALANLGVGRPPRGLAFVVGLVVVEALAVAYLHGFDIGWLLGARPITDPQPSALESLASILFLGVAIVITSGHRAIRDLRSECLDVFRSASDDRIEGQRETIAGLTALAGLARDGLPADERSRLDDVVEILTAAEVEPDARRRQDLLGDASELLRDVEPGHGSLRGRVAAVVDPWRVMSAITLRMDTDIDEIAEPLHDSVVRVVEEAVANSCRHGLAETVDIDLAKESSPDGLQIVVDDDGRGLQPSGPAGLGTTLFDEVSRGDYSLIPHSDGHGARLTLRIPLA